MPTLLNRIQQAYYNTFYSSPREYEINHNDITGPYRLAMRLADGPGMRRRLHQGIELAQRRIFLPLLRPGRICCDVGAHVGDYTVEMALRVGSTGRVFAYEAVPHYYDLLVRSVKANRLNNVVTNLAVVGAKHGKARVPTGMLTGSLARPGKIAGQNGQRPNGPAMVDVPVVCLDAELDWADAVKVDCEGYEVQVLKGMERLVTRNPGLLLLLEVHERQLGEVGNSLSELADLLLEQYGFKVHQIGFKHCLCSRQDLPLQQFPLVESRAKFLTCFAGT